MEEVVHATAGVDFWRLEEETWWYLGGLLALQVVGREVFKRYGPFKEDAALFVHQVTSSACITVVLALTRISNSAVAGQASSHSGAEECPRKYEKHTKYYNVLAHYYCVTCKIIHRLGKLSNLFSRRQGGSHYENSRFRSMSSRCYDRRVWSVEMFWIDGCRDVFLMNVWRHVLIDAHVEMFLMDDCRDVWMDARMLRSCHKRMSRYLTN